MNIWNVFNYQARQLNLFFNYYFVIMCLPLPSTRQTIFSKFTSFYYIPQILSQATPTSFVYLVLWQEGKDKTPFHSLICFAEFLFSTVQSWVLFMKYIWIDLKYYLNSSQTNMDTLWFFCFTYTSSCSLLSRERLHLIELVRK